MKTVFKAIIIIVIGLVLTFIATSIKTDKQLALENFCVGQVRCGLIEWSDPFEKPYLDTIKIIAIKKGKDGEIWVQYLQNKRFIRTDFIKNLLCYDKIIPKK